MTTGDGGKKNKVISDKKDKVVFGWGLAGFCEIVPALLGPAARIARNSPAIRDRRSPSAASWSRPRTGTSCGAAGTTASRPQGWPVDKELKWSGTGSGEVPPAVAEAAYACLPTLPIECFVTVLYPTLSGYEEFFGSDENTYSTALIFIAERYQRFLAHRDAYGVIVLDSRMRESDDRLRRFFTDMQREGTPFTELERIVDGLLFGPSHFSLGLQLADLMVGCSGPPHSDSVTTAAGSAASSRSSRGIPRPGWWTASV